MGGPCRTAGRCYESWDEDQMKKRGTAEGRDHPGMTLLEMMIPKMQLDVSPTLPHHAYPGHEALYQPLTSSKMPSR